MASLIVGGIVCLIIVLYALSEAVESIDEDGGNFFSAPLVFVIYVVGSYIGLGIVLGLFYLFAWFGRTIASALMWFIESVYFFF